MHSLTTPLHSNHNSNSLSATGSVPSPTMSLPLSLWASCSSVCSRVQQCRCVSALRSWSLPRTLKMLALSVGLMACSLVQGVAGVCPPPKKNNALCAYDFLSLLLSLWAVSAPQRFLLSSGGFLSLFLGSISVLFFNRLFGGAVPFHRVRFFVSECVCVCVCVCLYACICICSCMYECMYLCCDV
mgnify:CR=1 FL=1